MVDDAIIVLENIHRHIEHGMTAQGGRPQGRPSELAWPIVAMTTTLVAVYLPIGFIGGLTGTLFTEFAFTLAGAVLISGVVALTLSPMMCAKMLQSTEDSADNRLEHWLDQRFEALRRVYQRDLDRVLDDRAGVLVFGAVILASCYFLFVRSPAELAPAEDLGLIFYLAESDPYVTLEYIEQYSAEIGQITRDNAGNRGQLPVQWGKSRGQWRQQWRFWRLHLQALGRARTQLHGSAERDHPAPHRGHSRTPGPMR